jgi:adenylate cyclase
MKIRFPTRPALHTPFKLLGITLVIACSAIVLASTPFGRWLEEDIGLAWLFQLRGAQPAPAEVVVVSIDQYSSHQLQLPNIPRKWPRALHGKLVDRLSRLGASAIAFDIIFAEPRDPLDNAPFAQAMQRANNVVLFQYLKQENRAGNQVQIERLLSPIAAFKHSAFALAPFPLPKVPAKVDHFLLYEPELDTPIMPVTMLQLFCLDDYAPLLAMLQRQVPARLQGLPTTAAQIRSQKNLPQVITALRHVFVQSPGLGPRLLTQLAARHDLSSAQRQKLAALIRAYAAPYSLYLNLYGGPRSITTIPYAKVLQDDSLDLRGKAVFVGFSEQFQPEQKDGFYTVYTDEDSGLDISGVEIMATAFANLLQQNALRVSSGGGDILLLLLWSVLLVIALYSLPGQWQIPLALLMGLLYALVVYTAFSRYNFWLPFSVPLLWQLPLTSVAVLLLTYRRLQHERQHIRQAFGYHLPAPVVDRIVSGMSPVDGSDEHVYGIVLASDAAQYTALAERLSAGELHRLLNAYYEVLFAPIRDHGGIISDVQGDAALAIWPAASNSAPLRRQACLAALAVRDAVDTFNSQQPIALPTRLGLHCGEIVMGHVGALDHYEYRAVGDIVNSASRLEGLNKQLGTRILVSQAIISGLSDLYSRELGSFQLAGKQQILTVHELLNGTLDGHDAMANSTFDQALHAFRSQQWQLAQELFTAHLAQRNNDGPARFYLRQCARYLQNAPVDWQGAIVLTQK